MADGTLIFDTSLDTSGFDKGSQKMIEAAMNLNGQFANIGNQIQRTLGQSLENMGGTISKSDADKYFADFQKRMTTAMNDLAKYQGQIGTVDSPKAMANLQQKIEETQQKIEMCKQQLQDMSNVTIVDDEMLKLQAQAEEASLKIKELNDLRANPPQGKTIAYYDSLIAQAEKQRADIEARIQELENNGGVKDAPDTSQYQQLAAAVQIASDAYQNLAQQASQASAQVNANAQAKAQEAAQRQQTQSAIQQARLANQEARRQQIEQQTINQQEVAQARAAATELNAIAQAKARERVAQARAEAIEVNAITQSETRTQIAEAQVAATQEVAAARAAGQQRIANARAVSIAVTTAQRMVGSAMSGIGNTLSGAVSSIANLGSRLTSSLGRGAQGAFTAITGAVKKATSAVKSLASAVGSGLVRAFSSFKRHGSSTIPLADQLVHKLISIRTQLMRRLNRTFITFLYKSITEDIQALANHSKAFEGAMSRMKNSLKGLGANATVSFGSLIEAIEPIITKIISAISTAITYLNAFFALLSGKSTMTVAKKQTDKFGSSAGGAAKQVKELKNEVYGFDELNKRSKDSDSNGGGGGGGGVGDIYETVPIESILSDALMDYFTRLKEAIGMGEWEEAGRIVAEGMNYILGRIDEAILSIHDKAIEWTTNIARFLNGFVDEFDWALLGKTIADGLNLAFEVFDTFLVTFNWANLGSRLAVGLNSLVDHVDFNLIGKTIGDGFNAAIDLAGYFIENFNFIALGEKFAEGMNTFMNTVKWEELGRTVAGFINGINETLNAFANSADWNTWATNIGSGVQGFFTGTDWYLAGQTLNNWVNGVCTMLRSLTDNKEMWDSIRKGVAQLTLSLFDAKNIGNALEAVGGFVVKVFTTLGLMVRDAPWTQLASGVAEGLNKIFDVDKATELGSAWRQAIDSVINGAKTFIEEFDWSGATEAISAFINELLSIDWTNLVFTFVLGLGSLASSVLKIASNITEKFPEIGKEIASGLNKVFGKNENGESYIDWEGMGKNLSDSIKNVIAGIGNFLSDVDFKQIGNDIGKFLKEIKWTEIASEMWKAFKEALKAAFNLVEGISEAISGHNMEWNLGGFGARDSYGYVTNLISSIDNTELEKLGKESAKSLFDGMTAGIQEGQEVTKEQAIQAAILIGHGYANELYAEHYEVAQAGSYILSSIYNSQTVDQLVQSFSDAGLTVTHSFAESLGTQGFEDIMAAISLLGLGVDEATLQALNLTNLDANITSYMEQTGMSLEQLAQNLVTNTSDTISDIALKTQSQTYQELDETMQGVMDRLVQGSTENGTKVAEAAYLMLQGYGNAINEASPELFEAAKNLIDGIYNAQTVEEVKAKFENAGITITNSFAEKIKGSGKANIEMALQLLGQGVDAKTIEALDLTNLDSNLQSYMDKTGQSIQEVAGSLAQNTGETIGKILPQAAAQGTQEALHEATEAANTVADTMDLGEKKTTLETNSKTAGEGVPQGAGKGIKDKTSDVDKSVTGLVKAIEEPMGELTPEQRAQAEAMMKAIDQMISEQNPVVTETMKTAAEAVLKKTQEYLNTEKGNKIGEEFMTGIRAKIIANTLPLVENVRTFAQNGYDEAFAILSIDNGQEIGENFTTGIFTGLEGLSNLNDTFTNYFSELPTIAENTMESVADAIGKKVSSVADSARAVGRAVVETLKDYINYSQGYSISSNMISGLNNGISTKKKSLEGSVKEASDAIVSTIKNTLSINSPSKVFEEIGIYTMQGLELGIAESQQGAVRLMADTARQLTDVAGGENIDYQFTTTLHSLDQIADKLNGISETFHEIASVFQTMGDAAIPSLATGGFLPYKTRVEGPTLDQTQMMETFSRSAADQTEVLADQRDLIRELISTVQGLKLSLDVDSVTNAITTRQKNVNRSIGTVVV